MNQMQTFQQQQTSGKNFGFLKPGLTIRVHQKINDGKKERIQIFEGLIIAKKHGNSLNGTVTVRKIASGVGVERTFAIHSPTIDRFEVVKAAKTRRSKLYYIREKTAKETRRKTRLLAEETKKAQEAASAQDAKNEVSTSEAVGIPIDNVVAEKPTEEERVTSGATTPEIEPDKEDAPKEEPKTEEAK